VTLCETPITEASSTCRRFLLVSASTVDAGARSGVVRGLRMFRVQLLIRLPLAKIVMRMLVAIFFSTPQCILGGFLCDTPSLPSQIPSFVRLPRSSHSRTSLESKEPEVGSCNQFLFFYPLKVMLSD
jgi:hypothetical protein